MARIALLDRFRKRPAEDAPEGGPPAPPRAKRVPPPGSLRRERRALVRTREERIRDLGGLMLEMFRRDQFKQDLLIEQCQEVIAVEGRLREIDELLEVSVAQRREGRTPLHLRRSDPVGLPLLCELRAPGRRRAHRLVQQLRERPSCRRAVLRELRNRRARRERRRQRPGRRADDVQAGGAVGRSLGELARWPSRPNRRTSSQAHLPPPMPRAASARAAEHRTSRSRSTASSAASAAGEAHPGSRPRGAVGSQTVSGRLTGSSWTDRRRARGGRRDPRHPGQRLADEDARRDPGLRPVEHGHRADHVDADRHVDATDSADHDGSGATPSPAAVKHADPVARGTEWVDDRAVFDPAEWGPRSRRQRRAKGPQRRAHGRRNPRLVPVLEPAHGLLRGLHRRLRERERSPSRTRHGAGQLSPVVRPPNNAISEWTHERAPYASRGGRALRRFRRRLWSARGAGATGSNPLGSAVRWHGFPLRVVA